MDIGISFQATNWWVFTPPSIMETQHLLSVVICWSILIAILSAVLLSWAFSAGAGPAWKKGGNQMGRVPIPGICGLPIFGSLLSLSHGLAHRNLASMASRLAATQLMAFSLGSTPAVVASEPGTAREILTSPHFTNRPVKKSAKLLMFSRAIGFAPNGTYWRLLRSIASSHLFAPQRILAHEARRKLDCAAMVHAILTEQCQHGVVVLREHLQAASLNNIMGTVFGKRYNAAHDSEEAKELREMVKEGFELLGAFNWSDYLPCLNYFYDPCCINQRCSALARRVSRFVKEIIEEHRLLKECKSHTDRSNFVDVLLSLEGEEKLEEDDMVAVLWEMIFRGTDTVALLTEWIMAELILNSNVQAKLQNELDQVMKTKRSITYVDLAKLPYLQAIIKETLRVHPPGPLLSWARMSTSDVQLSNGMVIPSNTTAMVNMWAITHNPNLWDEPLVFKPERFLDCDGGLDVDVRGGDLRLAPFGAGRRVCPGKNLGLMTVSLWVAELVHNFKWVQHMANPVDLSEVLKLSCEMKYPLFAVAVPRNDGVKVH